MYGMVGLVHVCVSVCVFLDAYVHLMLSAMEEQGGLPIRSKVT